MIISHENGVAFAKTRHFSIALKGPSAEHDPKPRQLSIPLGFGARLSIRLR